MTESIQEQTMADNLICIILDGRLETKKYICYMFKYLPTIIAEVVINLRWSGEGWEEMEGKQEGEML